MADEANPETKEVKEPKAAAAKADETKEKEAKAAAAKSDETKEAKEKEKETKPTPKGPQPGEESGFDKDEEKALKEFVFYHGFIPREDLLTLLLKDGDYLLRVSEVNNISTQQQQQQQQSDKIKREIVLSICVETDATTVGQDVTVEQATRNRSKMRHVIIRRAKSKYWIEQEKPIDSIKELLAYYQSNYGTSSASCSGTRSSSRSGRSCTRI